MCLHENPGSRKVANHPNHPVVIGVVIGKVISVVIGVVIGEVIG